MSAFVPPFPPRHAKPLSVFEMVRRGSSNFLSIFDESAFESQTMSIQVLTQQIFICNSPDTVRHVLVTRQENYARKGAQILTALGPLLGGSSVLADGDPWAARRRPVASALHASHTATFLPAILAAATQCAERWAQPRTASKLDLLAEMRMLSADIVARILFGAHTSAERAQALAAAIGEYNAGADQRDLNALLGLPGWLAGRRQSAVAKSAGRVRSLVDDILAQQAAVPDRRCLAFSIRQRSGGEIDAADLRDELIGLFVAAWAPSAAALAWAFYLLSQDTPARTRLRGEWEAVLGARAPNADDLPALVFTRAVVEETVRLYPPVPLLTRQAAAADLIRDRAVAAGALVVIVPWLLHRHRHLWRDPDLFRPDRFLPDHGEPPKRFAYIPFSAGPRACAGASLATTTAMVCLPVLLRRFEIALAPGAKVEPVMRDALVPGDSLPVTVSPRVHAGGDENRDP